MILKKTEKTSTECSLCARLVWARGWCRMHYQRWYLYGSPLVTKRMPLGDLCSDTDRLRYFGWNVVQREAPYALGPCWEWNGNRFIKGYGRFPKNGTTVGAHVAAYIAWVGDIPLGHVVRHKCDNPPCINPEHLEIGTAQDNADDRVIRGRSSHSKPRAVLTSTDVVSIRHRYDHGESYRDIAKDYPAVSKSNIWAVCKRNTWKDIEEEN